MTIVINGTTGISGVDGSAGTPAVQGTDTNTGVFYPAADTVGVSTGGSERVRVDSSGNVGIGTSSPSSYGRLAVMTPTANYGYFGIANSAGGAGGVNMAQYYGTTKISYIDTTLTNGTPGSETAFLAFATANSGTLAERMRIDSSGNVGIGTSSPTDRLKVVGGNTQVPRDSLIGSSATGNAIIVGTSGGSQIKFAQNGNNDELAFITHVSGVSHTEQARITGAGLFQFNSGYGSVATAYGCRAWVNFNGTGTVAIRASGNVTSITDNGVGLYGVNLTTAMPDANYATIADSNNDNTTVSTANGAGSGGISAANSTTLFKVGTGNTAGPADMTYISAVAFR